MTKTVISILLLLVVPQTAGAQSWADAVKAGDYAKAADLLHEITSGFEPLRHGDAAAMLQLATMYAEGLGVHRDPVLACSLYTAAIVTTREQTYEETPTLARASQLETQQCGRLTLEERRESAQLLGCQAFGFEEQMLTLGRRQVSVRRRGIGFVGSEDKDLRPIICNQQFARVRALTVKPPADAAPGIEPRYFIDMFFWREGESDGRRTRTLFWELLEAEGTRFRSLLTEELLWTEGSRWARPALPPEVDQSLTLEMIRSGNIRWRYAGTPPKHGWILVREKQEER